MLPFGSPEGFIACKVTHYSHFCKCLICYVSGSVTNLPHFCDNSTNFFHLADLHLSFKSFRFQQFVFLWSLFCVLWTFVLSRIYNRFVAKSVGIRLIAIVGLDMTGNEGEHLRDDGQVLRVETSDTISFGQSWLYQMPECPSDVVAVTGEVTFLSFRCPYDTGNLSCHGWLFCYDCFHCIFLFVLRFYFWI